MSFSAFFQNQIFVSRCFNRRRNPSLEQTLPSFVSRDHSLVTELMKNHLSVHQKVKRLSNYLIKSLHISLVLGEAVALTESLTIYVYDRILHKWKRLMDSLAVTVKILNDFLYSLKTLESNNQQTFWVHTHHIHYTYKKSAQNTYESHAQYNQNAQLPSTHNKHKTHRKCLKHIQKHAYQTHTTHTRYTHTTYTEGANTKPTLSMTKIQTQVTLIKEEH